MATEKRLIDANLLDSKLDALAKKYAGQGRFEAAKDYYFVQTVLVSAPTVDAVEVMHGWWIELPGMEPDYKCSECGRTYAWWEPSEAHYCPNCGAKMDGDSHD